MHIEAGAGGPQSCDPGRHTARRLAKVGILKSAAENLTQTNRANDRAVCNETNENANRSFCLGLLEEGSKLFRRYWRGNQAPVETFAGAVDRNELRAILAAWNAQQNFVTNRVVA